MRADIEAAARDNLATVLETDLAPADLDLGEDMGNTYGLTSLNKVLFLMSVCGDTGVELSAFTEPDVAGMHTLGDVVQALSAHAPTVA
ncbi:MAG: acyl carrier protein [Actinomycetota bacterium]|nr:acyl carrier protein [Actinomycetota bacterium]